MRLKNGSKIQLRTSQKLILAGKNQGNVVIIDTSLVHHNLLHTTHQSSINFVTTAILNCWKRTKAQNNFKNPITD